MPTTKEKEKPKKIHIVDIVRHGDKLVLPTKMKMKEVIEVLHAKMVEEEEVTQIQEHIDAFIYDGALAMIQACEEQFGFAVATAKKSKTKNEPPKMISVEIAFGKTKLIPWGRFSLPGLEDGFIETGTKMHKGRIVFAVMAQVKRKYEHAIHRLIDRTREIVLEMSIYKGKAFKIRFFDDKRERLEFPEPSFLDVDSVKLEEIVFSEDVERAISTNLWTPIIKSNLCRDLKIPLKRGVLLSGDYGTGKTLVAYSTGKICADNNWTFILCERADELAEIIKFAHAYQPAVVFCEDIDRVTAGERSVNLDEILNIIDGVESKNTEIMIVLTTNHVEKINKAMLRPGRLDAVINVSPPDAEAVSRLLKVYGRGLIDEGEDLTEVGKQLEGKIPAVIREVIERGKLSAIKIGGATAKASSITLNSKALLDAAINMKNQLELLDNKNAKKPSDVMKLGAILAKVMVASSGEGSCEADVVSIESENILNGRY